LSEVRDASISGQGASACYRCW